MYFYWLFFTAILWYLRLCFSIAKWSHCLCSLLSQIFTSISYTLSSTISIHLTVSLCLYFTLRLSLPFLFCFWNCSSSSLFIALFLHITFLAFHVKRNHKNRSHSLSMIKNLHNCFHRCTVVFGWALLELTHLVSCILVILAYGHLIFHSRWLAWLKFLKI